MESKHLKMKKIITITMCSLICIMAIGYAAFATNLTINGTANITSTWKVLFTKIEEASKTSGVTITSAPTAEVTNATFNVDLKSPGDKIVYKITVANQGTLDAIISDITASETGSDAIKFEISGIKKGDRLAKSATTSFNVTISYDSSITSQPSKTNNTLTVNINYVQDLGQTVEGSDVVIEQPSPILSKRILQDNKSQPDTNIDFSQISSDTNGKGLYYTSTNTEDNKTTYYFRGAVENNYVSFANNIWRIVRINEDGSIRLIKQDSISNGEFNTNSSDAAYLGYMYGTPGSSTYAETHKNTNSSTIKTAIDTWYSANLSTYSSHLADAGFCGDRSLSSGTGIGTTSTDYGTYNRLKTNKTPQFKCPQTNDLYTTKTSTKGNKALNYPIALITIDEVAYAGGVYNLNNENYYLKNGNDFWTMSPFHSDSYANGWRVRENGYVGYGSVLGKVSVRPVINLKSTVEITSGDGTSSNPYTVKVN